MKRIWKRIKQWCIANLTPKGRKEKYFEKALVNLTAINDQNKKKATLRMQHSAGKILSNRTIKGFDGKKSLSKVKTSKHQLKKVIEHKHKEELRANRLKIQEKTLVIKDA